MTRRGDAKVIELTLLDIFEATVAQWGDRPAVDAPRGVLNYDDLGQEVEELADRLRDGGVGPGDRVGVRVPSGKADLYVAILGALTAGAAYVPVDADDPPARAEQIFAAAEVCVVVVEGSNWRGAVPQAAVRGPTPDDDAWIIFTSGSTGAPKGVAVPHQAAAAFVRAENDLWTVGPRTGCSPVCRLRSMPAARRCGWRGPMVRRWFPPRGHSSARASSSGRG